MHETKDNNFTWKDFQARNNNELVAILGNFVNRAMVLDHKYFAGKVRSSCGQLGEMDLAVMEEVRGALRRRKRRTGPFQIPRGSPSGHERGPRRQQSIWPTPSPGNSGRQSLSAWVPS